MNIDPVQIAVIFAALALGGVLKGATGAGVPVLAVPALAAVYDVKLAVVIMMMPNLLTNLLQSWRFREHRLPGPFAAIFAGAGAAGTVVGTYFLASLPHEVLSLIVAATVFAYVGLRLARPHWQLSQATGRRLAAPAGFVGGVLQGASGISAPVSVSFLNALRLARPTHIFTISLFFAAMTVTQVPALWVAGLYTWGLLAGSFLALAPILAFMPVGAALAKRLSPVAFDRVILALLTGLGVKLLFDAISNGLQ